MTGNGGTEDSADSFDSAIEERKAHRPDSGYNVVEINLMRPPGEAMSKLGHYPTLSRITLRPATDFVDYVVFDQQARGYGHHDLQDPSTSADPPDTDELIITIRGSEGKAKRVALFNLAKLTEENPTFGLPAVPVLITELEEASAPSVKAEALTIIAQIAQEFPREVAPLVDSVIEFLTPGTESPMRTPAIYTTASIADVNPGAVVDAVPKLAACLQQGSSDDALALTAIQRIAKEHPDPVVPITPQLIAYLDERDESHRIGALAVLGMLAKDYPSVAEDTIPEAIELLDPNHYKLRANAAGLLADLTDEYTDRIKSTVPRAVELLEDSDEKVRYNATSILAKVAKAHPEAAEQAKDPLIGALDEEFAHSRSNACWALGHLEAREALDRLRELEQSDPNEEVRHAASVAISEIEGE